MRDHQIQTPILLAGMLLAGLSFTAPAGARTAPPGPAPQPAAAAMAPPPGYEEAAEAEADYAIQLERPERAGRRYRLRTRATVLEAYGVQLGFQGAAEPASGGWDKDFGVDFEAVREVLEVDSRGRSVRESYTVERCTRIAEGESVELLRPGTVVIARHGGGETVFEARGAKLSRKARKALSAVVELPAAGAVSADDLYGSRQRHVPGETWPVNTLSAILDLKRQGFGADERSLQGTSALVAETEAAGLPALEMRFNLAGQNVTPPGSDGFKTQSGTLSVDVTAVYPLDVAQPPLRWIERLEYVGRLENAVSGPLSTGLDVRLKLLRDVEMTPLDEAGPQGGR